MTVQKDDSWIEAYDIDLSKVSTEDLENEYLQKKKLK
jgi:hypothetical protein